MLSLVWTRVRVSKGYLPYYVLGFPSSPKGLPSPTRGMGYSQPDHSQSSPPLCHSLVARATRHLLVTACLHRVPARAVCFPCALLCVVRVQSAQGRPLSLSLSPLCLSRSHSHSRVSLSEPRRCLPSPSRWTDGCRGRRRRRRCRVSRQQRDKRDQREMQCTSPSLGYHWAVCCLLHPGNDVPPASSRLLCPIYPC
ncbi:hypothetical protein LZ30DRAFT_398645 [Colletotrichum cereale]|nr:hypothetical protein LZ30DRAFT_398645 [Colletotrichum cereale]